MRKTAAFSLIELLIVIGIVAVLAAIIFPVVSQVKTRAKHASWIGSTRQVNLANNLYMADYDDFFVIPRYNASSQDPARDRTWVQLVLPYVRDFDVFMCPSDSSRSSAEFPPFDSDLVPGDVYARYYRASKRTNIGYNYIYLSPIIRNGNQWITVPKSGTAVSDPSSTLLFGDSAWEVENNRPRGGGHYLVLAPCRFQEVEGRIIDTTGHAVSNSSFFREGLIWVEESKDKFADAGGLWPWHNDRVTITMVGGNIKLMSLAETTAGCGVRSDWNGLIHDPYRYIWDLR